jgi:hypothetical protein
VRCARHPPSCRCCSAADACGKMPCCHWPRLQAGVWLDRVAWAPAHAPAAAPSRSFLQPADAAGPGGERGGAAESAAPGAGAADEEAAEHQGEHGHRAAQPAAARARARQQQPDQRESPPPRGSCIPPPVLQRIAPLPAPPASGAPSMDQAGWTRPALPVGLLAGAHPRAPSWRLAV